MEKNFKQGHQVRLKKDGLGYSIQLFQSEGFYKSYYSFNESEAKQIFKRECTQQKKWDLLRK